MILSINWAELSVQTAVTFGHFVWQGCLIAAALLLLERVCVPLVGRRFFEADTSSNAELVSANLRYNILCLALFAMPVCVVTTFSIVHQSRGSLLVSFRKPSDTNSNISELQQSNVPSPRANDSKLPASQRHSNVGVRLFNDVRPEIAGTRLTRTWYERFHSAAPYIMLAYALGASTLILRLCVSLLSSMRLRRAIDPITDINTLSLAGAQAEAMGLKRVPLIAFCRRIHVPVVVGILKPMILLPPAVLCGVDPNQLAAIIGHEMAHIRRYDLWVNLWQRTIESFLFFHPVTWWISRRISLERELCCDDIAADRCGRIEYADALLHLAQHYSLQGRPKAVYLAADGTNRSHFALRIKRLLGESHTARLHVSASELVFLFAATLVAAWAMLAAAQLSDGKQNRQSNALDQAKSVTTTETENVLADEPQRQSASKNSNWITAAQLCQGRAYSATAKAANWRSVDDPRSLIATPNDAPMETSLLPKDGADFTVWTTVRLDDDAACRLRVGDASFDLSLSATNIQLDHAGKTHRVRLEQQESAWVRLRLRRRNGIIAVEVNDQDVVDVADSLPSIKRISVASIQGTMGMKNFALTGDLDLRDRSETDSAKQSTRRKRFEIVDGDSGVPLSGIACTVRLFGDGKQWSTESYVSDQQGQISLELALNQRAWIEGVPDGWFLSNTSNVAIELDEQGDAKHEQTTVNGDELTVVKLWKGTQVTGRLVWPDKRPAAGVTLNAGVYINNQTWKEKLGMDLTFYSFDHGDWPNWRRQVTTDESGQFRVTVPPLDARWWFRIGTTSLSFSSSSESDNQSDVAVRLSRCQPFEIQYGGGAQGHIPVFPIDDEDKQDLLRTGDLQLETGVIVKGHVVDANGNHLANVRLTTTGPHGPHSGPSAVTDADGSFIFPAMAPGSLTVHPDARLRDVSKPRYQQVVSRAVQAVFVSQSFTIPDATEPYEIEIRAVPHTEIVFAWVDRRTDTSQPISYYGSFVVRGYMPGADGKPSDYWRGETELTEQNGQPILKVKVPTQLLNPELALVTDKRVTPSYQDSNGKTSASGVVALGDISAKVSRTIYGDDPQSQ